MAVLLLQDLVEGDPRSHSSRHGFSTRHGARGVQVGDVWRRDRLRQAAGLHRGEHLRRGWVEGADPDDTVSLRWVALKQRTEVRWHAGKRGGCLLCRKQGGTAIVGDGSPRACIRRSSSEEWWQVFFRSVNALRSAST